jgi:hypothetical protein
MLMVDASGPSALAPLGSSMGTGGGHCWRYRQHPPGGLPSTSPTLVVAAVGHVVSTPQGGRYQRLQIRWWPLSDLSPAPPRGLTIDVSTLVVATAGPTASTPEGGAPSTSPSSVVAVVGPVASTPQGTRHRRLQLRWWPLPDLPPTLPRGPAIDVFNFSGGRCRRYRQHPKGVPSTSPTSVVVATGSSASTPQGSRHRCLQLQWWSLLDLPPAFPSESAIDVFNFGGGRCRRYRQHPQKARHRHIQFRWWPLPEILAAPPSGPPSMSSISVVAAAGDIGSTPHGARHQRLQLRWWPLPDLPPAPPRGSTIDVFNFGGGRCRRYRQHPQATRHRCLQIR